MQGRNENVHAFMGAEPVPLRRSLCVWVGACGCVPFCPHVLERVYRAGSNAHQGQRAEQRSHTDDSPRSHQRQLPSRPHKRPADEAIAEKSTWHWDRSVKDVCCRNWRVGVVLVRPWTLHFACKAVPPATALRDGCEVGRWSMLWPRALPHDLRAVNPHCDISRNLKVEWAGRAHAAFVPWM